MSKRVTAFLVMVLMLFTALPVSVAAATSSSDNCTVTFYGFYGEILSVQVIEAGGSAIEPDTDKVLSSDGQAYVFCGWDCEFTEVTGDLDVHSVYALLGDISGDGSVETDDALLALRYALHIIPTPDEAIVIADADFDGIITTTDALCILRYALHIIGSLWDGSNLTPSDLFELRANKDSVFIGEDDDELILYLETNLEAESIMLLYGLEGELTNSAEMYDNGTGADDMIGDGVYSAFVNIELEEDSEIHFVAMFEGIGSNEVVVTFYTPISEETYEAMDTVDEGIEELLAIPGFYEASYEERAAAAVDMLEEYESDGQIMEGSIFEDTEAQLVSFMYPEGILGGVFYGEFDPMMNGETAPMIEGRSASGEGYSGKDGMNNVLVKENATIGSAIILNSFPAFETEPDNITFRTEFYEDLRDEWNDSGLTTTLLVDPTVNDYLDIDDYNVVCISTHGSRYSVDASHEYSAICLAESTSYSKDKTYSKELKKNELVKVNGCYWILPAFFETHFANNDFIDSFVFSECCMALGTGAGSNSANYDYRFANAFINRGAKAYVGYHNSVFAVYCREFMREYVNRLIDGKTSMQSFNGAIGVMGANHEVWFNNQNSYTLEYWYENIRNPTMTFNPLVHVAYPVHRGNGNAVLINNSLMNGGFEQYDSATTAPKYWSRIGDVRTVSQLGPIEPYGSSSNRMAIVTTGIGAQSTGQFANGTEGSSLRQTFKVPANATTIQFNYDFVSEEPMEYVGSIYNDSFVVRISKSDDEYSETMLESINSSVWYEVQGIDFAGGDSTAYQTGWKSFTLDVSQYRDQVITLSFIIYDVGDTLYDSAALIDNVIIK